MSPPTAGQPRWLPLVLGAVALTGCGDVADRVRGLLGGDAVSAATSTAPAADWTCPMHPSVHQAAPGSCPICGMDLIPGATSGDGSVVISTAGKALAGIQTAHATTRPMRSTLHATGTVGWDQTGLTDVTTRVMGYIRDAAVADVGSRVHKGQTLLTLYSPDLLVAQEELLAAMAASSTGDPTAPDRAMAARRRLALWGISDAAIDAVVAAGHAKEALPLLAPADGWVIEEDVVEGAAVMAGQRLYRIGDLRKVWVEAQVPEADLARVTPGMIVRVTTSASATPKEGRVSSVLPDVDSETRSGTVRIAVDNAAGDLAPAGWVTVDFDADVGPRLAVPTTAVVWTGPRRVVFVESDPTNPAGARYLPREVQVGTTGDGWVEIVSGLMEGEAVVVAGTFSVGSESRIRGGGAGW